MTDKVLRQNHPYKLQSIRMALRSIVHRFFLEPLVLLVLILLLVAMKLPSQENQESGVAPGFHSTHSRVDLAEWELYTLLQSAEQRGLIEPILLQKPYPVSFVRGRLREIERHRYEISHYERRILSFYIESYSLGIPEAGMENDRGRADRKEQKAVFLLVAQSDNNVAVSDLGHPHSINSLGLGIEGDVFPWLSGNGRFEMMLDRTNPEAFLPYTYSKSWDHHHYAVSERTIGAADEMLSISNRSYSELAASTTDGGAFLRFGRFRRDWEPGEGSLFLSDTARPFDGIEAGFPLGSFAYVSTVVGSLGGTAEGSVDPAEEQKMLSAHRLTVSPAPWVQIGFWDAVVWGKRLELAYMSPLSVYLDSQKGTTGDVDNSMVGFDLRLWMPLGAFHEPDPPDRRSALGGFFSALPDYIEWYGSIFIDEIDYTRMDELFTVARQMFAFYGGLRMPLKTLPFGTVSLQYSKLEPFVYTHYMQPYDFFGGAEEDGGQLININYTHDGENLGYPLPPNSDEFKLVLRFLPAPRLGVTLQTILVRHGDNPDAGDEEHLIMGDIDEPINDGPGGDNFDIDDYPEKSFLHDGIYERMFRIFGRIDYRLPRSGLRLYLGYGYAHMRNYHNIEGNERSRHSLSFGASYAGTMWH
ncbi:MAG: capsule assembly Wzi family protein [Spirochaetaceae bacterium]|nr:capsule assembly Wzi family protein [Spirochaetaceae bacterium]